MQRLAGARVLDLDRDLAPVAPDRPVDLADRGGRRRACRRRTANFAVRQRGPSSRRAPCAPSRRAAGEPPPAAWSGWRGRGPAISSGRAASMTDIAWPNFMAPPLSSPSTLNSCSAVRACSSAATSSAGLPPTRLPNPTAVRPAKPSGRLASRAVRATARRGSSLTRPFSPDAAVPVVGSEGRFGSGAQAHRGCGSATRAGAPTARAARPPAPGRAARALPVEHGHDDHRHQGGGEVRAGRSLAADDRSRRRRPSRSAGPAGPARPGRGRRG